MSVSPKPTVSATMRSDVIGDFQDPKAEATGCGMPLLLKIKVHIFTISSTALTPYIAAPWIQPWSSEQCSPAK